MHLALALALSLTAALAQAPSVTLTSREPFPVRAFEGLAPLPLQLDVATTAAAPAELRLVATLTGFDQSVAARQELALALRPGGSRWVAFSLTPPDFGFYTASVEALAPEGASLARFTTAFAVLPRTDGHRAAAAASIFGVNVHFDQGKGDIESLLRLADLAGIRWLRDTLTWPAVERTPDQYAIPSPNLAAWAQARERFGIRTLAVLCYDHPLFGRPPAKFVAYTAASARLLTGLVEDFEVWNEPSGFGNVSPEEYAGLLEASYTAIKSANPAATVVGLGGAAAGGWNGWYLPTLDRLGALRFMDTFSIHPYCSPAPLEIGYLCEGAPAPLANLDMGDAQTQGALGRIQAARGDATRPRMWVTEVGWPTTQVSYAGQAQAVSRALLTMAALPGVYQRMFLYDLLCDGADPAEMEHNFGLLEHDYTPRPSYVALANAARAVDGRPFLRRLPHPDPSVRLYLFGPESDPLLAAWCTEVAPEEVISGKTADGADARALNRVGGRLDLTRETALHLPSAATVTLTDWQGRQAPLTTTGDALRLSLTTWPQYLTGLPAELAPMP